MKLKPFAFSRSRHWTGAHLVSLRLFGKTFEINATHKDRQRYKGEVISSRAYVSFGWNHGGSHYGILFQHYREGYTFGTHTDGVKHNHAVTLVLHKPKRGGEFYVVDGPIRRWLRGRVIAFDGGQVKHGVSKIERGSRTVVMFQHGVY